MQRVREQIGAQPLEELPERPVTVAVLDTGIARHPDLFGKLLCFRDFVGHKNVMYDDNGHGTHVCGIICGSGILSEGRYRGIDPEARLVVGKVLDKKGDGTTESMLEGLKWIMTVREKYDIRILNISVGIGNLDEEKKSITLEVRQICRNLPTLIRQIEIKQKNIENAEHTYEINLEKYRNGNLTGMELQQYQNQLTTAKQEYTNAIIDYKLELLNLKIQTLWDFETNQSYLPVDLLK